MTLDDLIFVGLNGYVAALHRETGAIVWSQNELKRGYVTILLDGDRLIVSTNGYIYCLAPMTGRIVWHNPMKGYGLATASLVSIRGSSGATAIVQAQEANDDRRRRDSD